MMLLEIQGKTRMVNSPLKIRLDFSRRLQEEVLSLIRIHGCVSAGYLRLDNAC